MFPTEGHEQLECGSCNAVVEVKILKESEKATWPAIEFCPCCGLSIMEPPDPPEAEPQEEIRKTNMG